MRNLTMWTGRRFAAGIAAAVLSCGILPIRDSSASIHHLPESIARDAVSETVPSAFAPTELEAGDFAVEWISNPIDGVTLSLGTGTLQWVRVSDLVVLPRGRLEVEAANVDSGQVSNVGFAQQFSVSGGMGQAEIPVALMSGKSNRVNIAIRRGGQDLRGEAEIRLRPRAASPEPRVYVDTTCTPRGVRVETASLAPNQWIHVSCRMAVVEDEHDKVGSLEMYVYWEGAGETIRVGGIETPPTTSGVWALRLRSKPGKVTVRSGEASATLAYYVPDPLDLAGLALGLGPYSYTFQGGGEFLNTVAPVLTLYMGYMITEPLYLVSFAAAAIASKPYGDFGLYLRSESIRTLDQRMSINFLFGGHAIAFKHNNNWIGKIGVPQGFEAVLRDAVWRGWSMSAGAFLFPSVEDKLYYNLWYRFGKGPYFGEINYIAWQEKISAGLIYSRSLGLTFGFPIGRFW